MPDQVDPALFYSNSGVAVILLLRKRQRSRIARSIEPTTRSLRLCLHAEG